MRRSHLVTILLALLGLGEAPKQDHGQPVKPAVSPLPMPLLTIEDSSPSGQYLAVVVPRHTIEIRAPRAGVLGKISVGLGDKVARGDTIIILKDELLRHDLAIAEAALRTARATLGQSRIRLAQAREKVSHMLDRPGAFSAIEQSEAEADCELIQQDLRINEWRIEQEQTTIARVQELLARSIVVAPFDGSIAARYSEPSATVEAGVPILRLISVDDLIIRFAVPWGTASQMSIADTVSFSVGDQSAVTCTIEKIAPEIDRALRMVVVEASPISACHDHALMPGLQGVVSIRKAPSAPDADRKEPPTDLTKRP